MGTPIYDQVTTAFNDAVQSAEWRGRAELRRDMIALLKSFKKPTVAVKTALAKLEAEEGRK